MEQTLATLTQLVGQNQEIMRKMMLDTKDKSNEQFEKSTGANSGQQQGKRSRKFPTDRSDALEFVREALQHGVYHREYPPLGTSLTGESLYKAVLRAANDPEFGFEFVMTPYVAHSLTNLQFGAVPSVRRDGTEYKQEKGARIGDFRTKSMAHRYRELEFNSEVDLKDVEKRVGAYIPPANKFELMECYANWARVLAQICGPVICYLMMLGLQRLMSLHLQDERTYTILEVVDFVDIYMASWSRRIEECAVDPVRFKFTDEEHQMAEQYRFLRIPLMLADENDPVMFNNLILSVRLER